MTNFNFPDFYELHFIGITGVRKKDNEAFLFFLCKDNKDRYYWSDTPANLVNYTSFSEADFSFNRIVDNENLFLKTDILKMYADFTFDFNTIQVYKVSTVIPEGKPIILSAP